MLYISFYFGNEMSLQSVVSLRAVNVFLCLESLQVGCVKLLPFINGECKLY